MLPKCYAQILICLVWGFLAPVAAMGKVPSPGADAAKDFVCESRPLPSTPLPRSSVYRGTPYGPGELATFEVRYLGAAAGLAKLEVRPPANHRLSNNKSYWLRNFHIDAQTGDWYKMIFVAKDKIDALVRPWDYGVAHFYMEQDEGKMFGRRLQQKKWLDYNQETCKVTERTVRVGRKDKIEVHDVAHASMDAFGVAYWLREQNYELKKVVRGMVYSSEKSWWLDAEPLAFEKLKIRAGEFETVKVKLQTYLGKDLQQKGDVYLWIDTKTPYRPIVQIQAEIKIGSVWAELIEFKPGRVEPFVKTPEPVSKSK